MGLFDDVDDLCSDVDNLFDEIEGKAPAKPAPSEFSYKSKRSGGIQFTNKRSVPDDMAQFYDFVPLHRQSSFPKTEQCQHWDNLKEHGAIMVMSDEEFWQHFEALVPHVVFSEPPYSIFGPDGNHYSPASAVLQWRFKVHIHTAETHEIYRVIGISKKLAEFLEDQGSVKWIEAIRLHIEAGRKKHAERSV